MPLPNTHTEYRLFHRITFKNGTVGRFVDDGVHQLEGIGGVKWHVEFDKEYYGKGGRKVDFVVKTREVTEWSDLRPLTEDEMKQEDDDGKRNI